MRKSLICIYVNAEVILDGGLSPKWPEPADRVPSLTHAEGPRSVLV